MGWLSGINALQIGFASWPALNGNAGGVLVINSLPVLIGAITFYATKWH